MEALEICTAIVSRKGEIAIHANFNLKKIWADRVLYLMLLPCIAYFVLFHVVPIVGMKLAFYDYRILGDHEFVGLKYYKELFSTPVSPTYCKTH